MNSAKLALILASMSLALALAVNAPAAGIEDQPITTSWHGNDNHGAHGPHGPHH